MDWDMEKGTQTEVAIKSKGGQTDGGDITTVSKVPTLTCLWVQARNNIGRARFTNIQLQLLRHVKLQPYGFLSELRRTICPALHPWPPGSELADQHWVYADLGRTDGRTGV